MLLLDNNQNQRSRKDNSHSRSTIAVTIKNFVIHPVELLSLLTSLNSKSDNRVATRNVFSTQLHRRIITLSNVIRPQKRGAAQ